MTKVRHYSTMIPGYPPPSALAALFLAACLTPVAWAGALLEDVDGALDRYENAAGAHPADDFRADDLYGHPLRLSDYRGRIVVLSFIEARAAEEAEGWLRDTPADFMGDRNIAYLNVLFPGASPAFSSRSSRMRKLREEIENSYEDTARHMSQGDRARLEATEMRWVVDFQRDIFETYGVGEGGVQIFVIDAAGRVREVLRHRTREGVKRLEEVLGALRQELQKPRGRQDPGRPGSQAQTDNAGGRQDQGDGQGHGSGQDRMDARDPRSREDQGDGRGLGPGQARGQDRGQ